jgi:hypothetical protein
MWGYKNKTWSMRQNKTLLYYLVMYEKIKLMELRSLKSWIQEAFLVPYCYQYQLVQCLKDKNNHSREIRRGHNHKSSKTAEVLETWPKVPDQCASQTASIPTSNQLHNKQAITKPKHPPSLPCQQTLPQWPQPSSTNNQQDYDQEQVGFTIYNLLKILVLDLALLKGR